MIEEKYTGCIGAMTKILSSVEDVAFTCDAVTIPNSSRSFLTVTAHFLYEESLNSICLKCLRMDQVRLNLNVFSLYVFCRPLFVVFLLCSVDV